MVRWPGDFYFLVRKTGAFYLWNGSRILAQLFGLGVVGLIPILGISYPTSREVVLFV